MGEHARNSSVRVEEAVAAHAIPAYQRLLANEALHAKSHRNHGAWSLPEGGKYYQYAVELHTSTKMAPDELYALGLKEVERIGAEMDAILRNAGYKNGTLGERIPGCPSRWPKMYENTDAAREQILKDYQAIIDEIAGRLGPWFHSAAQGQSGSQTRARARKKIPGIAYYNPPAMDGSKPGTFFANLRKPDEIAVRHAYAGVSRGDSVTTQIANGSGNQGPADLPKVGVLHRLRRRLGARRATCGKPAFQKTCSTIWDVCKPKCSAPCVWWWTPASTPNAGRANKPSTSCLPTPACRKSKSSPKSNATSSCPARHWRTKWG